MNETLLSSLDLEILRSYFQEKALKRGKEDFVSNGVIESKKEVSSN